MAQAKAGVSWAAIGGAGSPAFGLTFQGRSIIDTCLGLIGGYGLRVGEERISLVRANGRIRLSTSLEAISALPSCEAKSAARPSGGGYTPMFRRGGTSSIRAAIAPAAVRQRRRPAAQCAYGEPTVPGRGPCHGFRPRHGKARPSCAEPRPRSQSGRDRRSPSVCAGHAPSNWRR